MKVANVRARTFQWKVESSHRRELLARRTAIADDVDDHAKLNAMTLVPISSTTSPASA
jgi:hypothetical protein